MEPLIPHQTTTTTSADRAPNDHTTITKGKRTKRHRPNINNLTHSSTSYNALASSPSSYSNFPTTAEDEDTANCLILLSKGHNINYISPGNSNTELEFSSYKFNSKRFIQTYTDATNGSCTGVYVYECKTCSRTFPSFQALGGHRASHKKPRINEFDQPKPPPPPPPSFSGEDEQNHHKVIPSPKNIKKSSSFSKLHECSICGVEFNSGQALGGHMRRHRAANTAVTATNTTLSLIPYGHVTSVVTDDHNNNQKKRNIDGLCLDLDLNFPAPPETAAGAGSNHDQHRAESNFMFKQKPSVHLSTLVDCHY